MKILPYAGLLLSLVSCLPRHYNTATSLSTDTAACMGDAFAIPGRNKAGQCLDLTSYRVVKWIHNPVEFKTVATDFGFNSVTSLIAASGVQVAMQNYSLVANFRHNGTFWIAQIPTTETAIQTIFQVSEFRINFDKAFSSQKPEIQRKLEELAASSPLIAEELQSLKSGHYTAAHGQLRIKYANNIELRQHADPTKTANLKELILSVHAVSPGVTPDSYDPVKGMQDEYGTSRGIYSVPDKVYQAIKRNIDAGKPPSKVRQYQVELTPGQVDKVLRSYLDGALEEWQNKPYNTLQRNCGSEIFDVFDLVLGTKSETYKDASLLGRQYPKYAQFALFANNLLKLNAGIAPNSMGIFPETALSHPLPTLNSEMKLPEPND